MMSLVLHFPLLLSLPPQPHRCHLRFLAQSSYELPSLHTSDTNDPQSPPHWLPHEALHNDWPTKPRHPTSTGRHHTRHPRCWQSATRPWYLFRFRSYASSILSSHGTVSSTRIACLEDGNQITISCFWLVAAISCSCQSPAVPNSPVPSAPRPWRSWQIADPLCPSSASSWLSPRYLQGLIRPCHVATCTAHPSKPTEHEERICSKLAFRKACTLGRLSYPMLQGLLE